MIQLPFTAQEFFAVFERYNEAVWPMQWVLYGLAALLVADAMQHRRRRFALVLLAAFWVWVALAYHLTFFADINSAAPAFAVLFMIEAALLLGFAGSRTARSAGDSNPAGAVIGKMLIAYALLGYPLVGYLAGQRYPEVPTFGAPCPTTIFTIGMLVWLFAELPWWIVAIPVTWAVIGTSAALQLGVPEDVGLTIAGLCAVILFRKRLFNQPRMHSAT